mgnify:CR=1 FL=1
MPVVKCAFSSPPRYEFVPDNTIKTVNLVKVEAPQCPLILMDHSKSIFFPEDVNTNANISFNLAYDTREMNFELFYGACHMDHGQPVPFFQFFWHQDISRHGQHGHRPAHISATESVNVPRHTIWQIGFKVSSNVADHITLTNILVSFEPWTSSPGKPDMALDQIAHHHMSKSPQESASQL